ncbi:MAG: endonuclease/exonuclease/phosphatase family protein [Opitutus sp.]|nr:endonuclease/exonuclease/phosphatase family protein [Opitutus sp.]
MIHLCRVARLATLGLGLLCLAVAARALTVATYNVENYLVTDRMVDDVFRQAYPKPESEKKALRLAIKDIAPDVLALQEMGTPPFLEELQRDLKADGVDYPHAIVLNAADPARHVAVLSKLPFKEVRRHDKVPAKYLGETDVVKRGVLEVTVATTEGDLTIFVAHLKSRRTERQDDPQGVAQRAAEAEALRDLVLTRFPDPTKAMFIVCGDWNDNRTSKPVRSLVKRGDTVIGEILRAHDSRGETWTHAYRREDSYSRIDYLMVSPALKPFVQHQGMAKIHDGPGVREASDHRPVYAELKLAAAQ